MRLIEKVWFEGHNAKYLLVPLLLPLTLLFFILSSLRRALYKLGLKKSVSLPVPVVVVGNIGIGGNGKTPVTIYLIEQLIQRGFRPGVISRGYGGKAPYYPYLLNNESTAAQSGDEPLLIFQRCKIPVAVGADRIAAGQCLVEQGCDIIIADDGLQHYRLNRDIELIVVDGKRQFGNGLLLPAGPNREGTWRLNTVNSIIVNGEAKHKIDKTINTTVNTCYMALTAKFVTNIKTNERVVLGDFLQKYPNVNAIAGIGDPQRFFNTLQQIGFEIDGQQGFIDHQEYNEGSFSAFSDNEVLLMTEKDAVKCQKFAQKNWWMLPVSAGFLVNEENNIDILLSEIISQIKK